MGWRGAWYNADRGGYKAFRAGETLGGCLAIAVLFAGCGTCMCVGAIRGAASPRRAEEASRPDPTPPEPDLPAATIAPKPAPPAQPAQPSTFGTCSDGTPARCSGKGCCSHHGGTGNGGEKRSHHKKR